jgi:lambda family phage minor tail protein L
VPLLSVPLSILQEKNQLATLEPFIWLYEITVPTDPVTKYRLTRGPEAVSYQGSTYSPFPISHDVIGRDQKGDLPETTLTVSNVSREIIGTLELYDGLLGQPVKIILAHSLLTGDDALPVAEEVFEVVGSAASTEAATLNLGTANLFEQAIPKARMMRQHCRHQYRSAQCGYSLDPSDANFIATCDKSLTGQNGCTVHGASYTSAGLTPIHPERFGGFPGIPRTTTGGGI